MRKLSVSGGKSPAEQAVKVRVREVLGGPVSGARYP